MNPGCTQSPHDLSLGQALQELLLAVERWHLHVGLADFAGGVGVAASRDEQAPLAGQFLGPPIVGRENSPGVKGLQRVHLVNDFHQIGPAHGLAPQTIQRVGDAHHAPLGPDAGHGLLR